MGGSSYRSRTPESGRLGGGLVAAMVVSAWAAPARVAAQSPSASVENGEWPVYHGNLAQHHYSPLDQIAARNFDDLEVAWTFKTDRLGTRPEFILVGTPLTAGQMRFEEPGGTYAAMWLQSICNRRRRGSCRTRPV